VSKGQKKISASVGTALRTTGVAGAWGTIGGIVGTALATFFPQLGAVALLAPSAGVLFSALAVLGVLRPKRQQPLKDLRKDLLEIDELFFTEVIDEREYRQLRAECLWKYKHN
jgi:hypothetical protein